MGFVSLRRWFLSVFQFLNDCNIQCSLKVTDAVETGCTLGVGGFMAEPCIWKAECSGTACLDPRKVKRDFHTWVRLTLVYCVRLSRERKRSFRRKGKKRGFFPSEQLVVTLCAFLKQRGLFLPSPALLSRKLFMVVISLSVINKKWFNFFGKVLQWEQIRLRGKGKSEIRSCSAKQWSWLFTVGLEWLVHKILYSEGFHVTIHCLCKETRFLDYKGQKRPRFIWSNFLHYEGHKIFVNLFLFSVERI